MENENLLVGNIEELIALEMEDYSQFTLLCPRRSKRMEQLAQRLETWVSALTDTVGVCPPLLRDRRSN
jgi:hypothetical protein